MFEIKNAPKKPGIYIFKKDDDILYVGKSVNIFNRMNQYKNGSKNSWKTEDMLNEANNVEFIITKTENDALVLERNLIDENNPSFNIKLRDNRRYPYLYVKLNTNGIDVKAIYKIRKKTSKNEYVFGPFSPGSHIKSLVSFLQKTFTYEKGLPAKNKGSEWYEDKFKSLKDLFSSTRGGLIKKLETRMERYSDELKYELAEELKNVIVSLVNENDRSGVSLNSTEDIDVIGFSYKDGYLFINILHFRGGLLLSTEKDVVDITVDLDTSIEEYSNAYYSNHIKPSKIYSNYEVSSIGILKATKGNIRIALNTAIENADNEAKVSIEKTKLNQARTIGVMRKLESLLGINRLSTIAMIDNSHEQNSNVMSGIIFYKNGLPLKAKNRRYNIPVSNRKADVEYMAKGIMKYLEKNDKPDLLILDGGKAHLNEINSLDLGVETVALVKDDNHKTSHLLNRDGKRINIKKDENLYMFLTKIQTEVDRYAKFSFRKKKLNKSLEGELSLIKGIGPGTESKLLETFGSYSAIYNATEEELIKVVSKTQAQNIIKKINK